MYLACFFIKSFGEVWKLKVIYVTNWKMLFKAVFPTGVLSRGPLWPLYLAVWDFLQKAFEVQTKSKSTKLCKKCTLPPFATKDSTLQWWLPERIKCLSFSIIWKHLEKQLMIIKTSAILCVKYHVPVFSLSFSDAPSFHHNIMFFLVSLIHAQSCHHNIMCAFQVWQNFGNHSTLLSTFLITFVTSSHMWRKTSYEK